ncbi:DNA helicase [Clostridium sp. CT7]|nr:DNA helicase [Clostridium sp. CT7]
MKKEGEDALNSGLVTYFRGKKIDNIYHIYSRIRDKNKPDEFNVHIKINFEKKKLDGVECSCSDFKELHSSGYNLKCSHIAAASCKFLKLLSRSKTSRPLEKRATCESKKIQSNSIFRLIRKVENDSVYYKVQKVSMGEWALIKPNNLRAFLASIEKRKIKFKFDYIEFMVPIIHKDLPLTFNLKEDKRGIVLTTHKQFPVPLNSNNDVYYYRNELYLPSKNQIDKYSVLYEKLKANGEITYRKNIGSYNNLICNLSSISDNINIEENLKNFMFNLLKPEFLVLEEKDKVYCCVFLNYGDKKVNILDKNRPQDSFMRDYKKEEKLIMKIENSGFIKMKNRFMFIGTDEELFNILSGQKNGIGNLGKIILGSGLNDTKVYGADDIKVNLKDMDGYYDFSYSIDGIGVKELNSAFQAYRSKSKFYKTKDNGFLDFEDDGIGSFFNVLEVLNTDDYLEGESIKLEANKALYVSEKLKFMKSSDEIQKIEDKLTNIKDIEVPNNFKGTLRDYQIKGFKWLKTLSEVGFGGILADEMGLGKTIQIIAFLLAEKDKKALIICPTSLIYNWKDELKKFAPDLKVLIIHGAERKKAIDSISENDVILTTYGTLRMDVESYNDIVFDYCIIDEAQNIKNASAKSSQAVKKIKADTKFALTGTPIENSLMELWSIFDFIMPGYLYSREKFEEKFILTGDENLDNLKFLIQPFILRRTKKEVIKELPHKIEKKLLVEMTTSQKNIYGDYVKRIKALMKNNTQGKIEIFSYLTRLRQICLDPSLVMEDYEGGSGKLQAAFELIEGHIASGGKVLLFSQFTSALNKLSECLTKHKIKFFYLDGKTKPKDRVDMVKKFNSSTSVRVFLISLKAGGTGLNLTSANLVIHFDPWWNPAVEAQAADRAHRLGQKNVVEVIKLVARGTIEEKIIRLQEDKKELIHNVITGELQNSSLSKEDLIQLLYRD